MSDLKLTFPDQDSLPVVFSPPNKIETVKFDKKEHEETKTFKKNWIRMHKIEHRRIWSSNKLSFRKKLSIPPFFLNRKK
jgi:hypothetical protein